MMTDHRAFVRFAASFEASLALIAMALGWATDIRPTGLVPDFYAVGVGLAATLPMIALYFVLTWLPWRPLRRIYELLLATLGRPLSECRWHELALLAALAGVCEELLFRGVLQSWISRLGEPAGWAGTNVLFGVAHAVTPTYFVLAMGIGFYLSAVYMVAKGNLAAVMIAHGLYDWFAFVQVAREYRRRDAEGTLPQTDDESAFEDEDETSPE